MTYKRSLKRTLTEEETKRRVKRSRQQRVRTRSVYNELMVASCSCGRKGVETSVKTNVDCGTTSSLP